MKRINNEVLHTDAKESTRLARVRENLKLLSEMYGRKITAWRVIPLFVIEDDKDRRLLLWETMLMIDSYYTDDLELANKLIKNGVDESILPEKIRMEMERAKRAKQKAEDECRELMEVWGI